MANKTITQLTAYTTPLTTDVIPIVDVTNNTTKKITLGNLPKYPTYIVATDGSGDYTTIQAAISALPSNIGKIHVKAGTYTYFTVSGSNIEIEGEGDSTIISFDGSSVASAISNSGTTIRDHLYFHDFKIISSSVGSGLGIKLDYFRNCRFDNINIYNTNGGIWGDANHCFYNELNNVYVSASGGGNYGFKFTAAANDNTLYSCRVEYNMENGFILNASGMSLFGCSAELCTIGVDIQSSASAINISGGWYENNTTGIKIASGVEFVHIVTKASGNTTNVSDLGCVGLFVHIEGDGTDPEYYFQDAKFSLTHTDGYMGLNLGKTTYPDTVRFQVYSSSTPATLDPIHTIAVSSNSANATNKYLGQLGWLSRDTSFSAPKLVAYIGAEATELYGSDASTGSDMVFYTGTNAGTNPIERMRLTATALVPGSSGLIALGTTSLRYSKGWFTDLESTNMPTVGGTAILTSLTAPQFTTIELGAASDTTLARVSAGKISVEGVNVVTVSSTDTLTNKTLTSPILTTPTLGVASATSLTLSGFLILQYRAASSTDAIGTGDCVLDYTSGTFTATLPTAVGVTGKQYVIKNSGTGVITVATTSSQTIDGITSRILTTQYDSLTIVSNGANWIII